MDRRVPRFRGREIMSWEPITKLDPLRISFQMQVIRVLLKIGVKAQLDGPLAREAALERKREATLQRLIDELPEANSIPASRLHSFR